MATLVEIPLKLLEAVYESLKGVPLPLLLLGLATTALSTIVFVSQSSRASNHN
jgi:hypothetical protein